MVAGIFIRLGVVGIILYVYVQMIASISRVANFDGWQPLWWYAAMIGAWTLLAGSLGILVFALRRKEPKLKQA